MAKSKKAFFLQFVRFAAVSMSSTLIEESVYILLMYVGVHYILAYFIGFTLSVLNAYYWNNKYVFKASSEAEKRVWWQVLGKTYLVYSVSLLVNLLLLFIWIDLVVIEKYFVGMSRFMLDMGFTRATPRFLAGVIASLVDMLFTFPVNFLVNKKWAYKQKIRQPE